MTKKTVFFCIFVLISQSQVFAWKNGQLTFLETQPVPVEVQKALQNAKPDKLPEFPAKSDNGKLQAEPQKVATNQNNEVSILITQNGVQNTVRNPRIDAMTKRLTNQINFQPYFSSITALLFSPDNKTLYAGTYGGGIRVIDVETHQETQLLLDQSLKNGDLAHHGTIHFLWCIKNPKQPKQWWLVSAGGDGVIKIWDAQNNQLISSTSFRSRITNYWKQNNGEILAATNSTAVRIAPIQPKMVQRYVGHISDIVSMTYFKNQLWTRALDKTVMRWDIETGQKIEMHSQILNAAISQDGKKVAVRFGDENLKVINSSNSSLQTVLKETFNNLDQLQPWHHLFLSNHGKYLAHTWTVDDYFLTEAFFTDYIKIWDLTTKAVVFEKNFAANLIKWSQNNQIISAKPRMRESSGNLLSRNISKRETITYNLNVNSLGSSEIQWISNKPTYVEIIKETEKTFGLFLHSGLDEKIGRKISTYPIRKFALSQISISPDAKTVALLFKDELEVIDVRTGKILATKKIDQVDNQLEFPSSYVLRFSDDSKSLLTWLNSSGTVWNARILKKQNNADCKKEVMGFITSPRAVVCNNGDHIALLPMPKN
jgi:WD40 repeat protein